MECAHFIVDGMLSGTGIRDVNNGGYIDPSAIGVSFELRARITEWLERYEQAHFFQFENTEENEVLDEDGIKIARLLKAEFPDHQITYFSNAQLKQLPFS